MKTKILILGLGVAALFAACAPEEVVPEYKAEEASFTATMEAVENAGAFAWKAEDAISLFDGTNNVKFSTLEGGDPAVFTGVSDVNAVENSALRPYVEGLNRYSGMVSLSIPSIQQAVADGYDPAAGFSVAYSKTKDLEFKNMFALLKITINPEDKVVKVQVTANNQEPLVGDMKVGPFDNPTIQIGTVTSDNVSLQGDLGGTHYIAVFPQTLTGGYTVTLTNSKDVKHTVEVTDAVVLERSKAYDIGSFTSVEWPSAIPGVRLLKASFEPGEFNVISEGNFQDYPDKPIDYRSSWKTNHEWIKPGGTADNVTCYMDNPTAGLWYDMIQVCALRPQTEYVYSIQGRASVPNIFTGARCWRNGDHLEEIAGPSWAPDTNWGLRVKEFNSWGCYFCDVFAGIWGDAGGFFEIDDVKLVPKGYDKTSMNPKSTNEFGFTLNLDVENEIESVGKVVAWNGTDGNVYMALYRPVIKGKVYENAIAVTNTTDINAGLTMTGFVKNGGAIAPFLAPEAGKTVIPNSAVVVDGKVYLHYSVADITAEGVVTGWHYSGFVVSEDNGQTWTKAAGQWDGNSRFAQLGLTRKDNYVYAVASAHGRSNYDRWSNVYVMRVAVDQDITDPSKWEYYNGTAWIADWRSINDTTVITCGDRSEPTLVWNEKFGRFMMIYRSNLHAGLVYRDADAVDGYWSGEKILTNDDLTNGKCFSASVLDVNADGELAILAPTIGNVLNVDPFIN